MAQRTVPWEDWRERSTKGAKVDELLSSHEIEDLVWLLYARDGGSAHERARLRDEIIARLRDDASSVRSHAATMQGLTARNRESTRAARADVTSARSFTRENVRIMDNRKAEQNAGARMRHNMVCTDDELGRAHGHLDETDAADDAASRESEAFAARGAPTRKPQSRV